jgi:hypothetical protein
MRFEEPVTVIRERLAAIHESKVIFFFFASFCRPNCDYRAALVTGLRKSI